MDWPAFKLKRRTFTGLHCVRLGFLLHKVDGERVCLTLYRSCPLIPVFESLHPTPKLPRTFKCNCALKIELPNSVMNTPCSFRQHACGRLKDRRSERTRVDQINPRVSISRNQTVKASGFKLISQFN